LLSRATSGHCIHHEAQGEAWPTADIAGAIRAEPHLSAAAKRHLIGLANELRGAS
jgi:hypothetical protein